MTVSMPLVLLAVMVVLYAGGVYLLLDFDPYLGYAGTQRQLRDLIERRHCQPHVLVLVGAKVELPDELEPLAVRFRFEPTGISAALSGAASAALGAVYHQPMRLK